MQIKNRPDLKNANVTHHQKVPNLIGSKLKFQIAMNSRQRYIEKLSSQPFFRDLLKGKQKISVNVEGKNQEYTFLMRGIKDTELFIWGSRIPLQKRDLVFILDPLERIRVFSKTSRLIRGKTAWREIRGFDTSRGIGNAIACQEIKSTPSQLREINQIGEIINGLSGKITFKKSPSSVIPKIMEYL